MMSNCLKDLISEYIWIKFHYRSKQRSALE